eukprot:jgi/Ulvmu1/4414/UM002_0139.1
MHAHAWRCGFRLRRNLLTSSPQHGVLPCVDVCAGTNVFVVAAPCCWGQACSQCDWQPLTLAHVDDMTSILQQLDNFYLSSDQLEDTPSRRVGVDAETEKRLRYYGCDRIQRAVVLLGLPQVVAATAQTLLHRFYCKKDLQEWHIRLLTVAVTWIAAKIEEQTHIVQLNDVALVFDVLQQRENGKKHIDVTDPKSDKFKELRAEIATKYEMGVFHALGFICHVDHPHKLTANLPGLIFYDSQERTVHIPDGLLQEAWGLANDSLKTTLCVRFRSLTIACACIFLAARRLGIAMPEDPPWWEFADTSFGDMATVCEEIVSLHSLPKPVYISVNKGETAASIDAKLAEDRFNGSKEDKAEVASGGSPSRETQSPTAKSAQNSGQAALQPTEARPRATGGSSPSESVQGGGHDWVSSAAFEKHGCDSGGRADSAADRPDRRDRDSVSDRRDRDIASDRRERDEAHRHRHSRKGHRESPRSSRGPRRKGCRDGPDNGRGPRDGGRDRSDSTRGGERSSRDRHQEPSGVRRGDERGGRGRGHNDSEHGRSRSGQGGHRRETDHRTSPLQRRSPVSGNNGRGGAAAQMQSGAAAGVKPSHSSVGPSDPALPGPPSKPMRTLINWDEMAQRQQDSVKATKRRPDTALRTAVQSEKVHCPEQRSMHRGEGTQ